MVVSPFLVGVVRVSYFGLGFGWLVVFGFLLYCCNWFDVVVI